MTLSQQFALAYVRAKLNLLSLLSKRKAGTFAFDLFCTPLRKSRRKPGPTYLQGEVNVFGFDGLLISGRVWNAHSPKKILIVHGFESSPVNFEPYIAPLAEKGYEVHAYFAPAHGESTGTRITVPLYADVLLRIIQLSGPFEAFIAHSLGGLALCHAIERLGEAIPKKMVLLAPATEATTAIENFFRFIRVPARIQEEFEQIIVEKGSYPSSWYSVRRALHNIQVPILWVHDENDPLTPLQDALKVKEDNHSNIRFVITKGLGHSGIYRESTIFRQVVDFL